MNPIPGRSLRRAALAAAACWLPAAVCLGIDNPDAPDLVAQFQARAAPYEARISSAAGTVNETVAAYGAYERFLDGEMNRAYDALAGKLGPAESATLAHAQSRWRTYRDAEFRFIEHNWTAARFGTSGALSRGAYRTAIVNQRTLALLEYLKNYP